MTHDGHPARVASPTMLDVVPEDTARALMDEVRAAVAGLEAELADAIRRAEDAEAGAANQTLPTLREHLGRLATNVRAEAESYAAEVRRLATERAATVIDEARYERGGRYGAVLRLAPDPGPSAGDLSGS